jgi:hypothetical protein
VGQGLLSCSRGRCESGRSFIKEEGASWIASRLGLSMRLCTVCCYSRNAANFALWALTSWCSLETEKKPKHTPASDHEHCSRTSSRSGLARYTPADLLTQSNQGATRVRQRKGCLSSSRSRLLRIPCHFTEHGQRRFFPVPTVSYRASSSSEIVITSTAFLRRLLHAGRHPI